MQRFRNMSIKYKLLIMLTASSIVPILFLGAFSYYSGTKALKMESDYAMRNTINGISENIALSLYQLESYSTMITQSPSVQGALKSSTTLTKDAKTDIANEMSNAQKYSSTPFKSMVITKSGEAVYNFQWPEEDIRQAVQSIIFERSKKTIKGDDFLHYWEYRESYIPDFEAEYHYYFYRNILDDNKDFLGFLLIDVNAYTFDRQFLKKQWNDVILLTDENGKVVSPSFWNGKTVDMIAKNSLEIEMTLPVQGSPWKIHILQDTKQKENMGQLIPVTIILLGAVLIIEYILFHFFNNSISKPLIELRDTVENLTQNGFQVSHHDYAKDEIGVLAEGIEEMSGKMRQLIKTVKEEERQMEKMEFLMLQAQIKPHFLYNSLNSIMLIAEFMGCENIKNAIESLVKILQYSIDNFDNEITILEELNYLESYVLLNNIRFKNKIKFIYDVPEKLKQQKIVKFLLQPLIENAIVHGLRDKVGIGTIQLEIRKKEDQLICIVEDNGTGISPERLNKIWDAQERTQYDKLHIGLTNIDKRIKLIYGSEYGMCIESKEHLGTKVTLTISSRGRQF